MTRQKTMFLGILTVIGVFVIVELIALLMLYLSVGKYAAFWKEKTKESGQFTYVALGDSAAQGIGASHPENGYVGIIAKQITEQTGKSVRVVNLSVSGATVKDALQGQLPELKRYKPDLVTIEIGANDMATFDARQFEAEFSKLASLLPKRTIVSNMPYFGSRPGSRSAALEATTIIERIVKKQPGMRLADLQGITKERESLRNYAADYFHPNNRAYKNWADAFWKEIEKEL